MSVAVQANLVQLKVAESKRRGIAPEAHEIKVPSPGTVRRFRETLIDPHTLASYTAEEVHLRLHEVWGQFCLMRWLLGEKDDAPTANVAEATRHASIRCTTELDAKHVEIHALLWRIRHEQRRREERRDAIADPIRPHTPGASSRRETDLARRIPAIVFGKTMDQASDEELLLGACQHAGMLAASRWILHPNRTWGEPTIMDVRDDPFSQG